jgi:5-formyltetrahydrofolate cyclo-ligase
MNGEKEKKKHLRKKIKEVLSEPSFSVLMEKSELIQSYLLSLPEYQKSSLPMFYVSMDREVYTRNMLKKAIADKGGIAVPFIIGGKDRIKPCKIRNFEDLEPGTFDILQPKPGIEEVPTSSLDIIIVPGLAFDRQGNRLGRGKGFYDNFLKSINPKTPKIALAFSFQIVEQVPITAGDIPVDKIITEDGIIACK